MTTITPPAFIKAIEDLDPQVREAVWRVVAALLSGGPGAALKEVEIASAVIAFDKAEKLARG